MKKCKKIISIVMLILIFLSSVQNIVLGATISEENLIRGDAIETNVKFDNGEESYEVQASYIYYKNGSNQYPAYCISYRFRWCR